MPYHFRPLPALLPLELFHSRPVLGRLGLAQPVFVLRRLDRRIAIRGALRIEAAGEQVGGGDHGQFVIGENEHRKQQLLRAIQLLGSGAAFGASFNGAGHLGDVQNPELRYRDGGARNE